MLHVAKLCCTVPLKFRGAVKVTLPFDLEPVEYYKEDPGLAVFDGFGQGGHLINQAKPLKAGTTFQLNIHDIDSSPEEDVSGLFIESLLGESCRFDPATICGVYAAMMSEQPTGGVGNLLNDGRVNIAFTTMSVACVYRDIQASLYKAYTWQRDGSWPHGFRVFSPA